MSNARNLARLIVDSGGDVDVSSLGNVPPSNDASALTTGTLPVGRLPSSGVDASSLTTGSLGTARLPAGSVIQVVQFNYTSSTSIATASYVALPILASITPSSTLSKILVRCVIHVGVSGGTEGLHGRLYRNGSVVPIYGDSSGSKDQAWFHCGAHAGGNEIYAAYAEYLDSPSSTSEQTYQIYGRGHSAPYPIRINSGQDDPNISQASRTVSSITLMEIAG